MPHLPRPPTGPVPQTAGSAPSTGIHDTLGHDKTNQLVDQGASMSYDELIAYAIDALGPPDADPR